MPARLDLGSQAHQIEGIGPAGWIAAEQGLEAVVAAAGPIQGWVVDHTAGNADGLQRTSGHAHVFPDATAIKGMADQVHSEGAFQEWPYGHGAGWRLLEQWVGSAPGLQGMVQAPVGAGW